MTELRIHWDCTVKRDSKAKGHESWPECDGHFFQILPMTGVPTHVCKTRPGVQLPLTIREDTDNSQKQLALRLETRYGNTRPAEKTSAQHTERDENIMGKRSAPATNPAPADEAVAPESTETPAPKATRARPVKAPAAKAVSKPKATPAPKAVAAPVGEDGIKHRRTLGDRGHLANSVEAILRQHEAGTLRVDGPLTVHKVRLLITNQLGENPSTGAVSAVFARWAEAGYIKVSEKPVTFIGFGTKWQAAKGGSLEKFLAAEKEAKSKARAAARAAKAA